MLIQLFLNTNQLLHNSNFAFSRVTIELCIRSLLSQSGSFFLNVLRYLSSVFEFTLLLSIQYMSFEQQIYVNEAWFMRRSITLEHTWLYELDWNHIISKRTFKLMFQFRRQIVQVRFDAHQKLRTASGIVPLR